MQPNNYLLNIPNPQQDVMQSVAGAMSLKGMMEQRKMNQEAHAQDMQFGRMKQDMMQMRMDEAERQRAAMARAAEAERLRASKRNAALQGLRNTKNPSPEDFKNILLDFPELKQTLDGAYGAMNDAEKKNLKETAVTVYRALDAGQTDIAVQTLERQLEAAEQSGDDKKAAGLKSQIAIIKADPDSARITAPLMAAPLMDDKEFNDSFGKAQDAESKRTDAVVKLAEFNLKKEKQENGYIDPEKAFDHEEKLRKEYNKRIEGFTESTRNLNIIKSSSTDNSGAGDIALVTSFMKMLDPGSVVRETEFATARDTAGLLDNLKNMAQKIEDGQFLSPSQRKSFVGLAKKYMAAAEKAQSKVKKDMGNIVKTYKLNPDNVFGLPEEEKPQDDTATPTKRLPTYEEAREKAPNLTQEQYDAWVASKAK